MIKSLKKTLDISNIFIIFMIIIMLFKNYCTIILKIKLLIFDKDCKIKIKYKAISLILLFLAFSLLGIENKDFSISRRSNSPIKEVRGSEEKGKNSIDDINYYSGSIQLYFSFSPTELKFYKITDPLDINEFEYDKVSLIVR